MEASALIRLLTETLEKLGVEVSFEAFAEEDFCRVGGVCRVKGRSMLILDRRLEEREKVRRLVEALRRCDLEGVFLPPAVRRAVFGEDEP